MDTLRFAFAVPGMAFEGDTLNKQSLGGSETAALCLMRELAALGHKVLAFTNTRNQGIYDGVRYIPLQAFSTFAEQTPHDVCVVQRAPELFIKTYESRLNVLWCHDLAMRRHTAKFRGTMWNIDKIAVVSRFMAEQYKETYGIPAETIYVTRNGIDLHLFKGLEKVERDPKKLIFSSRPERGLDVLLSVIFPKLLERDPELRLYVAAYENPVEHLQAFYGGIVEKIKSFDGKVIPLGSLTKQDLYKHFAEAACLPYPTPSPIAPEFSEVSCITAMEAMAAGLPFVSSNRGALPETLAKGAGVLIDGNPTSNEYVDAFCDAVIRFTRNKSARDGAGSIGKAEAKKLSWKSVAKEWSDDCLRYITENNESAERLAHHFFRRSNIILAKKIVDGLETPSAKRLKDRIVKEWPFIGDKQAYAEQYAKIGETHTDIFEAASHERRLGSIISWLTQHPEIKTLVDIGCGLGVYAINMSNACPELKVTAVDIDPATIEWCEKYKAKYAKYPDNLTFKIGREDEKFSGFDCAMACEVLEHVDEPWDFLNKLQAMVKPGGYCFLTVPYGPWEAMSYNTYPHRAHLWEYELADFEDDMLKDKPNLEIDFTYYNRSPQSGEGLGHFLLSFKSDEKEIPPIDIDRKLRLQRPMQTVSATIMAGGNAVEETAEWCLRSVRDVANEIIVVDCGMSETARRIVDRFADLVIPHASPLKSGFEAPRNTALAEANMDWVLWIDMDERLLGATQLFKYLRDNTYPGYSVKQHHFSVDAAFPPDMPVRLFRLNRKDGKKMRFFGMLHEHPETALNEGPGEILVLPDTNIAHVGYLTEDVRRARFSRNHPLLQADREKYPKRILQQHFIMRDNMLIAGYILQQNGSQLTPEIEALARETVKIYREHFLGKKQYANVDSRQYYSQALSLLGEGVDLSINIQAARDGVGDQLNGGQRVRFATIEEAQIDLGQILKEKMEPLTGKYW